MRRGAWIEVEVERCGRLNWHWSVTMHGPHMISVGHGGSVFTRRAATRRATRSRDKWAAEELHREERMARIEALREAHRELESP